MPFYKKIFCPNIAALWLIGVVCIVASPINLYAQKIPPTTAPVLHLSFSSPTDSLAFYHIAGQPIPIFEDTSTCRKWLNNLNQIFYEKGFWGFSIDSLRQDNRPAFYAKIYVGKAFKMAHIHTQNIEPQALAKIGYRPQLYQNKPLKPTELTQLQHRLIDYYENKGYPFVQTKLSNIHFDNKQQLAANLELNKGNFYTIDSLTLTASEENPISIKYLHRYLGIENGSPYNENLIKRIEPRLRELPFLQITKAPQVTFGKSTAKVFLFVKRKRASRFDFLLGLQPNTNPQTGKQRYQVAGEGLLDLRNVLGIGETIGLQFKNYPANIREIKVNLVYPYLPLLPVGGEGRFELYLRDTLFRNVSFYIGAQYLLRGNNYLKAYFQGRTTDVLSIDSIGLAQAKKLPKTLDVKSILYGLEWNMEQLDYRLNPRKGWAINLNSAIGRKNTRPNTRILSIGEAIETDFMAQYDSLNQQRLQWQATVNIDLYCPLGKRATFKVGLRTAYQSAKNIYENELYRIGGHRLLRGFDQESILASMYSVATLETRYLLGQNSYVFIFTDMAYTEQKNTVELNINRLMGLGLGMTFETKAGIFALSYAIGKQQGNPFDFRAGKIHFGYVNYF